MRALPPVQQPSPRQEQAQSFPEQTRGQQVTTTRSPKTNLSAPNAPNAYPPSHSLPQLGPPQPQPHERAPSNAGGYASATRGPAPPSAAPAGPPGPSNAQAPPTTLPPYGRPFTPPTEIRPIREERPSSPGSTYPHQQYHHGPSVSVPNGSAGGIAAGAPAPASAMAAAEAAARERDERPASAMKRVRDWEGEPGPAKKIANEENRARLDEQMGHHVTPPNRMPSPGDLHRRSSSEARREEQRRVNENYHPSEAVHHPPTLPSIQHIQQQASGASLPPIAEGSAQATNGPSSGPSSAQPQVKEESSARKEQPPLHEPAARKMDVDENYDDDEDEKRAGTAPKGSPHGSSAGNSNSNSNGVLNGGGQASQPKQEAAA